MSEWVTVSKICLCHVHGGTIGLELLFLKILSYHIISYHIMEGVCLNLIVNIENSERGNNSGSCLYVDPTGRGSWSVNFFSFFNLCHRTSSLLRLFCVGGRQSLKGNRKRHQVTDWQGQWALESLSCFVTASLFKNRRICQDGFWICCLRCPKHLHLPL